MATTKQATEPVLILSENYPTRPWQDRLLNIGKMRRTPSMFVLLFVGSEKRYRGSLPGKYMVPTPEQLEEAKAILQKRREEATRGAIVRRAEVEKRNADPKWQLVNRFESGMTPWGLLTLEQLQQIAAWLDAAKAAASGSTT